MAPREGAQRSDGLITHVTSYIGQASGTFGQKVPVDAASARSAGGAASLNSEAFQIRGAGPEAWFGPMQPMAPFAPPGTGGRQWDYPYGINLLYTPRGESEIPFAVLRAFADTLPDLRIAIEHRKAEVAAWEWDIQPVLTAKDRRKQSGKAPKDDPRVLDVKKYFRKPDKRHHFSLWLGALMEDMLVVDAACIYPRYTWGGDLYSLDLIDGTTIKPLIDETGRQPMPEDGPAFQQVLHGVPAADFTLDDLMYMPRNIRSGKLYGFSPVEWIMLTINIALRRQVYTLDYYTDGSIPQGFFTLPKEWGPDQIASFQRWWDDLMAGNLAGRRRLQFMPGGADGKFTETKQAPLKDVYDEWLMRLICAALNVAPSPFVNDNTRATAQTIQLNTSQRGIESTKLWIKSILDDIIQERLGYEDLEFVWSGSDETDPLEQAQALQVLISCGVKTVDEGRVELGLDPFGIGPTTAQPVTPLLESYKAQVEDITNPKPPLQLPPPEQQPTVGGDGAKPPTGKQPPSKTEQKDESTPTAAKRYYATGTRAGDEAMQQAIADAVQQEVAKLGAIPFDGEPSATKYSDDQPRDEHGRWIGTGATYDAGAKQWTRADGSPLPDHLAGTKIPPAWTDVKFAEDPKSELLVVGKDEKGRPQYVYSDEHWSRVAAEKFARVDEMEGKYQSMMAQNEANRASGDEKTQAHADALETVAKMGIRPGSETDTKAEKQAYGATTLLGSHVVQTESGVRLQFTGKKGVDLDLPVDDKGLSDRLTARAAEAGPDGKLFPGVSDASLRDYTHTMDGGDFKPKDFRTRLANDVARTSIASRAAPTDEKSYQRAVRAVAKDVSTRLGNTPTVALQSYINPAVFGGWRMGAKA